jgi:hypothetical protein
VAVFNACLIDVGAIGQDHVSKGALVLVVAVGLDGDIFPEGKGGGVRNKYYFGPKIRVPLRATQAEPKCGKLRNKALRFDAKVIPN